MRSKTQFSGVRRASKPTFVNVCIMYFPFCELALLGFPEDESTNLHRRFSRATGSCSRPPPGRSLLGRRRVTVAHHLEPGRTLGSEEEIDHQPHGVPAVPVAL